jgi:hypothetical protein
MSMAATNEHLACSKTTGLTRAIGAAVAFCANPDTGLAWPSNEMLVENWGFPLRTIQTALRSLEDLGEIVPQPQLQTRKRKRVYLVTWGQTSLLDSADFVGANPSAPMLGANPSAMAAHACAGSEPQLNRQEPIPPTPKNGGAATFPPPSSTNPRQTPRPSAAAARRSRRRRSRSGVISLPPAEPCPLDSAASDPAVEKKWAEIARSLRGVIGDAMWEIWLARAHAHQLDDTVLVLGIDAARCSMASHNYRRIIARTAGVEVAFVPCAAVSQMAGV